MRKTIPVEDIKNQVNNTLATYTDAHPEFLSGIRLMLENILHQTDNYRGYQYLDKSEVPANCKPGCHFEFISDPKRYSEYQDKCFVDTDPNRVRYY